MSSFIYVLEWVKPVANTCTRGQGRGKNGQRKNSFTLFFSFEMFTTSFYSCNELELVLILNFVHLLYCGHGHLYDGISKVQQHYEYSIHGGLKVYNYLGPTKRKSQIKCS